jgi:hypothetical protein
MNDNHKRSWKGWAIILGLAVVYMAAYAAWNWDDIQHAAQEKHRKMDELSRYEVVLKQWVQDQGWGREEAANAWLAHRAKLGLTKQDYPLPAFLREPSEPLRDQIKDSTVEATRSVRRAWRDFWEATKP